jgi:hypothetical protein
MKLVFILELINSKELSSIVKLTWTTNNNKNNNNNNNNNNNKKKI